MYKILYVIAYLVCFSSAKKYVDPPDHNNIAEMARYIMKYSDWVSLATISTQKNITGYPFVTLKSVSDGTRTNSTGIPYLYMTDLDLSGQDVLKDNRVTIMCSLEQADYCQRKDYDPQDPRCAKLMITGRLVKLSPNNVEYSFGFDALLFKHPQITFWPSDHGFYVSKIDIEQIAVLDFFGGIKYVSTKDYFQADIKSKRFLKKIYDVVSVVGYKMWNKHH